MFQDLLVPFPAQLDLLFVETNTNNNNSFPFGSSDFDGDAAAASPCPSLDSLTTPLLLDCTDLFDFVEKQSCTMPEQCPLPSSTFKVPSAIPSRLVSATPTIGTPGDLDFLYPSPFESTLDFNLDPVSFAADLAFAAAMTPHMNSMSSFLAPSPMIGGSNSSPFVASAGTFPDPAFTNVGGALFDDFSMNSDDFSGLTGGEDFTLFDDIGSGAVSSTSTQSLSTPSAQQLATPMLPMTGTPMIPLQGTPFMPSASAFPDQQGSGNVTISMEDLTALLQLANNKNVNLGAQNLALLQQQLSAASNSVAPAAGPSKAFDLRHKAGGKAEQAPRRRPSKFYTCSFPNCGKQFTRAFNLKTHEQTHDVDRPRDFVCEEPGCGKTFVRIHDLSRHAVAHDQSKWHFCGTCNRGFARIDALKRHEKSTASCRGDEVVA